MPLRVYDHKCQKCGKVFEMIVERDDPGVVCCTECDGDADRLPPIININMGVGAYGYYDETLNKGISTNKQLKEEMRKQNVTKKGDTPKSGGAWV